MSSALGTGYEVLLLLHLLSAIGGFGLLAYNGLYLSLSRRRGYGAGGALAVNAQVSGLAEGLVYASFVFGVAAVGSSRSAWRFSQAWVIAAMVLYLAILSVMHGWIRPRQRRFFTIIRELEADPKLAPMRVGELDSLERRISAGWGAFNILVVGALYLMVFRPGA
jgi:hypothetical protein